MRHKDLIQPMPDSPVESLRKRLPKGKGDWPSFGKVYSNVAKGCEAMARSKSAYLGEDHIFAMAALGTGDEETMKAVQMKMRDNGWI